MLNIVKVLIPHCPMPEIVTVDLRRLYTLKPMCHASADTAQSLRPNRVTARSASTTVLLCDSFRSPLPAG